MTELTFLVDLLLNHKLSKLTRDAVASRIGIVEQQVRMTAAGPPPTAAPSFQARPIAAPAAVPAHMVGQSPSTIAALIRQEQTGPVMGPTAESVAVTAANIAAVAPQPPQPVAVIAQTPAAAAALADRNAAIIQGVSGKPEKGRTSPKKW